jgi:hypothetical protein
MGELVHRELEPILHQPSRRQRWARVRPALAWKHPGLPTKWTRALERNPDAMNPEPGPGFVWLGTPGKVLHASAHHDFPRPPAV